MVSIKGLLILLYGLVKRIYSYVEFKLKKVLITFLVLLVGCSSPTDTTDIEVEETTITFAVNVSESSTLPSDGAIKITDSDGTEVESIDVSSAGTYTFEPVSDTETYSLIFSEGGVEIIDFGDYNIYNYDTDGIDIGVVLYKGVITYHEDWIGSDCYIVAENIYLGTEQMIAVSDSGSFELYDREMEDGQNYNLYTFRDLNNNGKYGWANDDVTFLQTENGAYSDLVIAKTQINVSGTVDLDILDAAVTGDPDYILNIADNSYWVENYQLLGSDGTFNIYSSSGHTLDITLTQDKYMPVRLAGAYTYTEDTAINGTDNISLNKITINITDDSTAYSDKDLMIGVGQSALTYNLYNNGTSLSGSGGVQTCDILFRTFDRTTATSGTFLDDEFDDLTYGYGAFVQFFLFIDLNHNGILNPSEPRSSTYYVGDLDDDGIPVWGADFEGDFCDSFSDSKITGDMEISLSIEL